MANQNLKHSRLNQIWIKDQPPLQCMHALMEPFQGVREKLLGGPENKFMEIFGKWDIESTS